MNDFLWRFGRQSHESGAAKTFLAVDNADNRIILGFYSLAPARWYTSYGAVPLTNKPLTLVMSLATFAANLKTAGRL